MTRIAFLLLILVLLKGCAMNHNAAPATTSAPGDIASLIHSLWDFNDKPESERRFREALKTAGGEDALEIETQIARTFSLRRDFTTAHAMLDDIQQRMGTAPRPALRVRYLLERGRSFNSAGQFEAAKPMFQEAYDLALTHPPLIGLAIDAAHMFGFSKDKDEAFRWTALGMKLALSSDDPAAVGWRPGLANNLGSTERERGNLDAAMKHFRIALAEHQARGKPPQIFIAHWQVANVLRLQSKIDESLAIQQRLETEMLAKNAPDAYVYDELAELHFAKGDRAKAKIYAEKSLAIAEKDEWVSKNEVKRLSRLRELAK